MAAHFWNCTAFDPDMSPERIEQGAAYAMAENHAERIAHDLIKALNK